MSSCEVVHPLIHDTKITLWLVRWQSKQRDDSKSLLLLQMIRRHDRLTLIPSAIGEDDILVRGTGRNPLMAKGHKECPKMVFFVLLCVDGVGGDEVEKFVSACENCCIILLFEL